MTERLPVFIHIPKTAGTAFRAVIDHNISGPDQLLLYRDKGGTLAEAMWWLRNQIPRARIVSGHAEARVHEFIEDRECAYFTILRDPVERVVSLYKFIKYDFPSHPAHQRLKSGELTLEQWVGRPMTSNVMTKMISGLATEYEPSTPAMLTPAVRRLHSMIAVGIQERFNESVDVICSALGWEPIYVEKNRSSMKNDEVIEAEKIPASIIEKIRQANRLDIELYQEALSLFDSRSKAKVA